MQVLQTLYNQVIAISPALRQVESRVCEAEKILFDQKQKNDLEDKLEDKISKHVLIMNERNRASETWCLGEEEPTERLTSAEIQKRKKRSKRAKLNVGGVKHEVMWKML